MASEFTHLDPLGRARMVDVTAKDPSHRRAVARCRVHMEPETASKIASGAITKGDVLAVARVAGIQAAKQTANLLPLCHPLLVGSVFVNFRIEEDHVEVETQVDTRRPHRRRDGGAHRLRGRRADDLRHVQVGRSGHDDRRSGPLGEDRRPLRRLAPARAADSDDLRALSRGAARPRRAGPRLSEHAFAPRLDCVGSDPSRVTRYLSGTRRWDIHRLSSPAC